MQDIYYIGGSPCSGKSTIAEQLAAEYGFIYYKLDDFLFSFMEQAARAGKPHCRAEHPLTLEQMWMRDPQLQADGEFTAYDEMFPYVLQALTDLGHSRPIVAEGAGFTPNLIANQGVAFHRYICIVPTEAFQREKYAQRDWVGQFLSDCKDPEDAFENWMRRDALFARKALRQAQALGYPSITVDGTKSIAEHYQLVKQTFLLRET